MGATFQTNIPLFRYIQIYLVLKIEYFFLSMFAPYIDKIHKSREPMLFFRAFASCVMYWSYYAAQS